MNNTAYIFPGQGSQYVGMGKSLYESSPEFAKVFDDVSDILEIDIKTKCFDSSEEELKQTQNTQVALSTVELAYYQYLITQGLPTPKYLAGHSLGEYAALVCAGALSLQDAMVLIQKRGELMHEAAKKVDGNMCAINGIKSSLVQDLCLEAEAIGLVSISAFNAVSQVVISGEMRAVEYVMTKAENSGGIAKQLKVGAPFHCDLMKPMADEFAEYLDAAKIETPQIGVISNVTGKPYKSAQEVKENLITQLYSAVRWEQGVTFMTKHNVQYFVEVGPGKVLKNLLRKNKGIKAYSLDITNDLSNYEQQLQEDIENVSTPITRCLKLIVSSANQCFDKKNYQIIKDGYQSIMSLQSKLEKERRLYSREELISTIDLTRNVLLTKGFGKSEIDSRLNHYIISSATL